MLEFLGCPICNSVVKPNYIKDKYGITEINSCYCRHCKKTFEINELIIINKTKKELKESNLKI